MCLDNEKCKDCGYMWDCPHAMKNKAIKINMTMINTNTVHLATRFSSKETFVLVGGKEEPIQKIRFKDNKVILIVSE